MQLLAQQAIAVIALQQQITVIIIDRQMQKADVAKPSMFGSKREKVTPFIDVCQLYIRIKIDAVSDMDKVGWVLIYVYRGVAEIWKDNLLEELEQETQEFSTAEDLYEKIKREFGEINEQLIKVDQLQLLEQNNRTYDEYVQEFKKVARGSKYEEHPLQRNSKEKFKRGLNRVVRRRLAEAKSLSKMIGEWQERAIKLDCN